MEIGVDPDQRVYVWWHGGGPWTVLDDTGRVSTEPVDLATVPWCEDEYVDDEPFNVGYAQGWEDAKKRRKPKVDVA